MAQPLDLVGNKYGKLLVTEYMGIKRSKSGHTYSMFKCVCDCGNECIKTGTTLKAGEVNSCGCLYKEMAHKKPNYHGKTRRKLYQVWSSFRGRCNNPTDAAYHNYGGRGIGYAPEWDDYLVFEKWALENGYQQDVGLTLERIDVNKGYTPENCCWADRKRQSNNKRNNLYFTIDGVTHTLAEWCEIYNVPYGRVDARINSLGWSFEDALFKPLTYKKHTITYKGRTLTTKEWAKETGLSADMIRRRLKNGWTPKEIIETPKMSNGGSSEWRKTHR
jgi:hypothetical protein